MDFFQLIPKSTAYVKYLAAAKTSALCMGPYTTHAFFLRAAAASVHFAVFVCAAAAILGVFARKSTILRVFLTGLKL